VMTKWGSSHAYSLSASRVFLHGRPASFLENFQGKGGAPVRSAVRPDAAVPSRPLCFPDLPWYNPWVEGYNRGTDEDNDVAEKR
jgi:hypothetical protein